MRAILIVCFVLIGNVLSAAQVSINCTDKPVDAVIADLTRQSGEKITLAAPSDVRVTTKLSDVPLEESLEVVSRLCGGTFVKTDAGYRVYPKAAPEHVLGLVRGMYSRIKDYQVITERKAGPNSAGIKTLTTRLAGRSTGESRLESEYLSEGKVQKDISVEDGQCRWSWRPETCHVEKQVRLVPPRYPSIVTATGWWGLQFLADPDARKPPNLVSIGAEMWNGRPVYMMQYDWEDDSETCEPPETGKWAPPPGQPGMSPESGFLSLGGDGPEMQYRFVIPSVTLEPSRTATKCRFGVDAESGLMVFDTAIGPDETYEVEATDIREVAPGISLPFGTRRVDGGDDNNIDSTEISVRVNVGVDESLFEYKPARDVFVVTHPTDNEVLDATLEECPDDPDLLYTRAHSMTGMGDPRSNASAVRDYERALASRPAARRCLLLTLLELASDPRTPEVALKYVAEVRSTMPSDTKASLAIARAYRDIGMDKQALEEFDRFSALIKKRTEVPLCEIAQVCERLGDNDRAERLYLEVLAIGGANECDQAARDLQAMCPSRRCLDALRGPVEAATKRLPNASNLLFQYGLMLARLDEPDAAMAAYRQLAKSASGGPISRVMRELKSAKDYEGAKEIAAIYMSRPDDRSGSDGNLIFGELADIYMAEGITVPRALEVYREFMSPYRTPSAIHWRMSTPRQTLRRIFTALKVMPEAIETVHGMWKSDKTDTDLAYLLIELAGPDLGFNNVFDPGMYVSALRDLIEAWPNQAALYARLGDAHVRAKDYTEAAKALRQGMELSPNQPYYYAALAEAYSRIGDHDKALDLLRRLVARAPANDDFYCALGVGYANAGQWQDAVVQFLKADELQQAETKKIYRPDTLMALIRCYENLGDTASAERCWLLKVDRANPEHQYISALTSLVEYYLQGGQLHKAIAQMIRLEAVDSLESPSLAVANFRWRTPEGKRKDLATVLASSLAGKPKLVGCRLLLVDLYSELRDFTSAMPIADEAIALTWSDPMQLDWVRERLSHRHEYRQLYVRVLERLIALEPNRLRHVVELMDHYADSEGSEKALEMARGLMRYARGEMPLPRAAGIKEDDVAASCGEVFLKFEKADEAVAAFKLALELSPASAAEHLSRLAGAYAQSTNYEKALSAYTRLTKVARYDYQKTDAIRQSAFIYERLKKNEEALKCWQELLSLVKDDRQAQGRIKMLTAPPAPPPTLWPALPGQ